MIYCNYTDPGALLSKHIPRNFLRGGPGYKKIEKFARQKHLPVPPTGVFFPKEGARAPWAHPLGTSLLLRKPTACSSSWPMVGIEMGIFRQEQSFH